MDVTLQNTDVAAETAVVLSFIDLSIFHCLDSVKKSFLAPAGSSKKLLHTSSKQKDVCEHRPVQQLKRCSHVLMQKVT